MVGGGTNKLPITYNSNFVSTNSSAFLPKGTASQTVHKEQKSMSKGEALRVPCNLALMPWSLYKATSGGVLGTNIKGEALFDGLKLQFPNSTVPTYKNNPFEMGFRFLNLKIRHCAAESSTGSKPFLPWLWKWPEKNELVSGNPSLETSVAKACVTIYQTINYFLLTSPSWFGSTTEDKAFKMLQEINGTIGNNHWKDLHLGSVDFKYMRTCEC